MRGRAIAYSSAELAWIEANRHLVISDLATAFASTFSRSDVSADHLHALRKRKGWSTGRTGQFAKGQPPANKGKTMPYNANSAATRFRKGGQPHNTKWLGHERLSRDGYIEVSVAETNPHTGFDRRYVLKHRYLWEQANGPVPKGYALKCLDGDKANTTPSNWTLIARSMLPRLNGRYGRGYDDAPAELKPTIMAITELEHRAREKRRAVDQ